MPQSFVIDLFLEETELLVVVVFVRSCKCGLQYVLNWKG